MEQQLQQVNQKWWIPSFQPSLEIEELITKRLNTKKPIDVAFMKRTSQELTIPTGATYSWKLGNVNNSVRFIFIAFKKTDAPTAQTNNALFTGEKITSMRIQMNNVYYPIDRMQFNFDNYNIMEPYNSYVECCKTFGNEPQLNVQEFHDLYPVFCFDVSAQPQSLKSNGIDITLIIEKTAALTLQGHALLLEDTYHSIDIDNGRMLRLN
jgi:hypothetical protein